MLMNLPWATAPAAKSQGGRKNRRRWNLVMRRMLGKRGGFGKAKRKGGTGRKKGIRTQRCSVLVKAGEEVHTGDVHKGDKQQTDYNCMRDMNLNNPRPLGSAGHECPFGYRRAGAGGAEWRC